MKKLLSLLLVVCMILTQSVAIATGSSHQLHLKIDFEENLFMSRYDVDVYLNGSKVATIPHGDSLDQTFPVPAGICTISFQKTDAANVCGTMKIGISADTEFVCDIKATYDEVEISNVATTGEEVDMRTAVGETIEVGGLRITLTKYRISNGSSYNKPESGNVFMLCEFEMQNISDDEISLSTVMSFDASCDDYELDYSFSALLECNHTLDETIRPGKKLKGEMGFEVPKNWVELEIVFTPDLWSDDQAIFIVTR